MSVLEAVLLGTVQGLTEFLPVSSSGHLVVAQELLGVRVDGVLFEAVVHVATLVSILLVYRRRVWELARGVLAGQPDALRYAGLLALASVPAAVVGLLWRHDLEALFERAAVPGAALLVTGLVLLTARWAVPRAHTPRPGALAALLVGVAQAAALVPGISRSGSTVVAALWLGVEAEEAAAFSFLMAVPAIAGVALLQLPELGGASGPAPLALAAGGVAAAITGVLAIRTFVALLARRAFHWFAPYCWAVGGLYLGWLWLAR